VDFSPKEKMNAKLSQSLQQAAQSSGASVWQRNHLGYWLLLAFAVCVYASGLGGHFIPRNGDEMVYAHIARLTAASGQWLPLVSELNDMRNTKPPVLFWQALIVGDWGAHWTLWALRMPSLLYTLCVTAGIVYLVKQLGHNLRLGLLAGVIYLAFFCTFRYGRPYLTSAAETFWFNLPIMVLLLHHARMGAHSSVFSWLLVPAFGVSLAMGLLYKSFALIAPAGACLAWVAWCLSQPCKLSDYAQLTIKVGISCALALGIFALWFVIDPDPQAVWREFVVGENAGKMSHNQGYWRTALWGGSSMWVQLLGYAQNAGLLAFAVVGAMALGVRSVWRLVRSAHDKVTAPSSAWPIAQPVLWAVLGCLAIWLIIFTLPSQRSARYLIPAMPWLAIVLALLWQRVHALWFAASLASVALGLVLLSAIGWAQYQLGIASTQHLLVLAASLTLTLVALIAGFRAANVRGALLLATFGALASFNAAVAPLDSSAAALTAAHSAQWRGKHIAVPDGFNGQFERYQFILPANRYSTYDSATPLDAVLPKFDAVMWVGAEPPACAAQKTCALIASRWDVRTRHTSGEITLRNVLRPQEWLFRREWMVSRLS
jgi:4-amino-4-deoxy-L-arabinose transferase-like glycosyltransferase